jgi:hypothetical protein
MTRKVAGMLSHGLAAVLTFAVLAAPAVTSRDADAATRTKISRAKRAEANRIEQERKRAEEANKIAEQERRVAEQKRNEEQRLAEERARAEEHQRAEDARRAEEQRVADQARQVEERHAAQSKRKDKRARSASKAPNGPRDVTADTSTKTNPLADARQEMAKPGKPVVPTPPNATSELPEPKTLEGAPWTDQEVVAALAACVEILAPLGADVKVSKPLRDGACGAPAPVLLKRIGSIDIAPPALVTCPIVASMAHWVKTTLDPTARELLRSPVRRIVTLSGYSCRNRIGTTNQKISEHAKANAIDIAAIVTEDGQTIDVLSGWGETLRDARRLAEQAKSQTATTAGGGAAASDDAHPADAAPKKVGGEALKRVQAPGKAQKPARVADMTGGSKPVSADTGSPEQRLKHTFLQRLHEGACGEFGTVLGPEANEAHRNHLHFDLEPRRRSAFCE